MLVASAVLACLAGCTTEAGPDPRAGSVVTLPPGDATEAAVWLLGRADDVTGSETVTDDDLRTRFTDVFADPVATAALRQTLDQVRATGRWEPAGVSPGSSDRSVDLVLRSTAGDSMAMHVTVDSEGRVGVLSFGYAVDRDAPLTSAQDVQAAVAAVPASAAVTVSRAQDGRCVDPTGFGDAHGTRLPMASVVKVVVLGAAVIAVADGRAGWTDPLVLTDGARSLPSGRLAVAPEGSTVTLEQAAAAMVRDSDNTATDLLVAHLGPEAVEAAWATMVGAPPEAPFLTTREVFELGWGSRAESGDLLALPPEDLAARRAALRGGELTVSPVDVDRPRWPDGIDWFATSDEICSMGAWLHEHRDDLPDALSAVVRGAASAATGRDDAWLRKSGGAPGVVAGLWVVDDGTQAHVVAVQFASEERSAVGDIDGLLSLGPAALDALVGPSGAG